MTLWEILERRRPFEGLSQNAVQAQWMADPYSARLPPVRLPEGIDRAGKCVYRGLSGGRLCQLLGGGGAGVVCCGMDVITGDGVSLQGHLFMHELEPCCPSFLCLLAACNCWSAPRHPSQPSFAACRPGGGLHPAGPLCPPLIQGCPAAPALAGGAGCAGIRRCRLLMQKTRGIGSTLTVYLARYVGQRLDCLQLLDCVWRDL